MFTLKSVLPAVAGCIAALTLNSCSKPSATDMSATPTASAQLSYGSPEIYLRSQAADYIVYPVVQRAGTYSAFPDGLELDPETGAINVSKSETGIRYRVTYVSPVGVSTNTLVLISGINYTDKFYHLSAGDSLVSPVYNLDISRVLPVSGSVFDDGNAANTNGCAIKTNNGTINLKETIRRGAFGNTPVNGSSKDFDIAYRLNDASGKSLNKITVRIFYYEHISDISPDLLETLNERQQNGVFIGGPTSDFSEAHFAAATQSGFTTSGGKGKDRPPCVVIIAN